MFENRKLIDWKKTGNKLFRLRSDNFNLRRYVCHSLRYNSGKCSGDCINCQEEMDNNISRSELSKVFNVSESVIFNWETGRSEVGVEDLLFYCQIAEVDFKDIIVYIN